MTKQVLLTCLLVALVGCGQKSTIKISTPAEPFSKTDVDAAMLTEGEPEAGIVKKFSVPLVTDPLPAPVKAGPVTPVARSLANLLIKVSSLGKKKFSVNQPVPDLPAEFFHSVKLSRVFFVIEGENFDFLQKLVVTARPKRIQNELGSMIPSQVNENDMSDGEKKKYFSLFDPENIYSQMSDLSSDKDPKSEKVILKYDGDVPLLHSQTKALDYVYVISTNNPPRMMEYLRYDLGLHDQGNIRHIEQMDDAVLIEIKHDKGVKSVLEYELRRASTISEMGMKSYMNCNPAVCIDLNVPTEDLFPMLMRENSIQLDAYVSASRVPKADFKLRGFVQLKAHLIDPLIEL